MAEKHPGLFQVVEDSNVAHPLCSVFMLLLFPPPVPILRMSPSYSHLGKEVNLFSELPSFFWGLSALGGGSPSISFRHLEIVYLLPHEEFSLLTNSDSLKKRDSRDERAGGLQAGRAPQCFCAQRGWCLV